MSRDLEREYRGLVNSEVPDLWTRIEAGLEEKNTAPGEAKTDIRMTDFQASGSRVENVRGKKRVSEPGRGSRLRARAWH